MRRARPTLSQLSVARTCWRSRSMGTRLPSFVMHQNVQPLQAGASCTAAPTWWIEPRCSAEISVPSARTRVACRRRRIGQHVAGMQEAALDQSCRTGCAAPRAWTASSAGWCRRSAVPRRCAPWRSPDVALVALQADIVPAQALGDGAGRAAAEEGVEHHVARLGRRHDDAVEQGFRLLRGVCPSCPSLFSRSGPRRSGSASRCASAGRRSGPSSAS